MNEKDYQKIIVKMINKMDETDIRFLKQIYTLVIKHLERKKGH